MSQKVPLGTSLIVKLEKRKFAPTDTIGAYSNVYNRNYDCLNGD